MNKALFIVKRAYNKAIDKVMGATCKIDFALACIDEQIMLYGEAHTACVEAKLEEKQKLVEGKIRSLQDQRDKLIEKRGEYEAKIKVLEAQLKAQQSLAKISDMPGNYTDVIGEIDRYIKHLEAELSTMEFINGRA